MIPSIAKDKALLRLHKQMDKEHKFKKIKIMDTAKKLYSLNSKKMLIAFNVQAFNVKDRPKQEESTPVISNYSKSLGQGRKIKLDQKSQRK